MNFGLFPLAVIQSILLTLGQVTLKFGLMRMEPFGWTRSFWISVFGAASLLWMYILKHYPLSSSYPLVSLSYVFGLLAAMVFFQEEVDFYKWLGVSLIVLGCFIIAN